MMGVLSQAVLLIGLSGTSMHLQAELAPGDLEAERCQRVEKFAKGVYLMKEVGMNLDEMRKTKLDFDTDAVVEAIERKQPVEFIAWNCYNIGADNLRSSLR